MPSYPKIPKLLEGEYLLNMFGKLEIEKCAFKILEFVILKGSWGVELWYEDYIAEDLDDGEKLGFILLVAYGWLEPVYPDGTFTISLEFAEHIVERLPVDVTRRHLKNA